MHLPTIGCTININPPSEYHISLTYAATAKLANQAVRTVFAVMPPVNYCISALHVIATKKLCMLSVSALFELDVALII